jgi:ABC-type oligopeptide transport system ATPase subunit
MTGTVSLLEVRDLTVEFRRGHRRPPLVAVDRASLTVAAGETVALVGESGSGKSTLGNAVLGLVVPLAGSILFQHEDITRASKRRRRHLTRDIQVIFQDPYSSLNPVRTIGQALAEPLNAHSRLPRHAVRNRAAEALERVGLPADAARRYPGQFSGGQRQRIAIARALMVEPLLLICDEPTSSLDLSIQAQLLNLFRQLRNDLNLSCLFITHDLAIVPHIAHRVVVMNHGHIVETGTVPGVYEHPVHQYTKGLLDAIPTPDPVEQRRRRATR